MIKLREIFSKNRHLIWGAIIHGGLTWGALALSYNSYKEYVRSVSHLSLPSELKEAIKATFPWGALVFAFLYLLYGLSFYIYKRDSYPTVSQYIILLFLYIVTINLLFISSGNIILIVINLSSLYLTLLLFVWGMLKRFVRLDTYTWIEEILPPIIYRAIQNNLPTIKEYCKAKPSAPFIIGFMVLLILCATFLIFSQEKLAEQLANVAYFLLVIGVGIELYQLIKYGDEDDK